MWIEVSNLDKDRRQLINLNHLISIEPSSFNEEECYLHFIDNRHFTSIRVQGSLKEYTEVIGNIKKDKQQNLVDRIELRFRDIIKDM